MLFLTLFVFFRKICANIVVREKACFRFWIETTIGISLWTHANFCDELESENILNLVQQNSVAVKSWDESNKNWNVGKWKIIEIGEKSKSEISIFHYNCPKNLWFVKETFHTCHPKETSLKQTNQMLLLSAFKSSWQIYVPLLDKCCCYWKALDGFFDIIH